MANQTTISPADQPIRDPEQYAEKYTQEHIASPEDEVLAGGEPPHNESLTSVAAEALRTGVYPEREDEEVPGEDDALRAGDPDVDPLQNLYSGEQMPGGSTPTPDQGNVEDAGRAAGITEVDSGSLVSAEELSLRRDQKRWEQEPLSPKT
jgi:hypothetical protein